MSFWFIVVVVRYILKGPAILQLYLTDVHANKVASYNIEATINGYPALLKKCNPFQTVYYIVLTETLTMPNT